MANPEPQEIWESIQEWIANNDFAKLEQYLQSISHNDKAWLFSRLDDDTRTRVLKSISTEVAADVMEHLYDQQAADMIEEIPVAQAAAIVDEMASDEQADLLGHLEEDHAEAILRQMDPEEAEDARLLLQSAPDSAGGIMVTEYLAYPETMRADKVLADLTEHGNQYSDYEIQYIYVTSEGGALTGVVPLRTLLLASKDATLNNLAIRNPLRVQVDATLDELSMLFGQHGFIGIPVTNNRGVLLGAVLRRNVLEAVEKRSSRMFLSFFGILGGEEFRSMPLLTRSTRRLLWLTVNIFLNMLGAAVIASYQETLASAIALSVFLPIISDMSGNAGNQAVAVSIRELTLGQVKPHELVRVLLKEAGVGVINGAVLGVLIGLMAVAWKGNPYLGLVVGGAMSLNSIIAVSLGGLIPLLIKGAGKDPALASSPILTTLTDVCGFFLVLHFATKLLPQISG